MPPPGHRPKLRTLVRCCQLLSFLKRSSSAHTDSSLLGAPPRVGEAGVGQEGEDGEEADQAFACPNTVGLEPSKQSAKIFLVSKVRPQPCQGAENVLKSALPSWQLDARLQVVHQQHHLFLVHHLCHPGNDKHQLADFPWNWLLCPF